MTSATAPLPSPVELLNDRIQSLQWRINSLQSSVLLSNVKDAVEDLDTTVSSLGTRLGAVRTAGYVFDADLDKKSQALAQQWIQLRSHAQSQIAQQTPLLQGDLRRVESQMTNLVAQRANLTKANSLATTLESALSGVESKVSAAEGAIQGSYDAFQNEAQEVGSRLTEIEWLMEQTAEATFQLLPTEGVAAAVEAKWDKDGKDDPKGVLFLTDQRLLFEQKEEVATKKVLFIAMEKEKIQKLLLEANVANIDQVKATKKGLMGHEDHLDVNFSLDGPVRAAHFHLDGQDCNLWAGLIGRAKAKDFDKERTVKVDQAVLDKIANAPTKCGNCGSPFTKPIMRGQTEIKCEYCGAITRL